jgi:hypothetical protein
LKSALVAGLVSAGVALPSHAVTYNWDFGNLLSGSFSPSATFATLSATTTDNMHFVFDLKANNLDALFTSGAFLTALSVSDTNAGKAADPTSVSLAPGTWGVSSVGLKANASGPGGSSVWDFDFTYPTSGASGGSLRLTALEEVKWNATFKSATFFNDPAFAIHVQGLTKAQGGSAWYTSVDHAVTPIPEPQTYLMLLAGLGLMGFVARRRQQDSVET